MEKRYHLESLNVTKMQVKAIKTTTLAFSSFLKQNDIERVEALQDNITDMIAQIRVSESLYSTALQAEVNVLDSANLLEKVKCVSGERLTFIVKRSLMDGTLEKYKPIFRIAEIHSMAKLSPGTNTYVFRCISMYQIECSTF